MSEKAAVADAFTCPRCATLATSPIDAQQGYCRRCHEWTGSVDLTQLYQYARPHSPPVSTARPL